MENQQKLYYRGVEIIREINYSKSMCKGCVADRLDGHCGLAIAEGGTDEKYYCTDSENEYVFKYKEEV